MTVNPYESPRIENEFATRRRRIRITPGTFLFIILGLMSLAGGVAVMIGISQDTKLPRGAATGFALGTAWLIVIGILLMLHGILRTTTTINAVTFVLLSFAAVIVLLTVINSL